MNEVAADRKLDKYRTTRWRVVWLKPDYPLYFSQGVVKMSNQWTNLVNGKNYILDLGEEVGSSVRYAVWIPDTKKKSRHRIAMAGNNLDALMEKFQISEEYVFSIAEDKNERRN